MNRTKSNITQAETEVAPVRKPTRARLVFVQHCPSVAGSAISGLTTVAALARLGFELHVIFSSPGPLVEKYREAGCTTHTIPHKNWLASPRVFRTLRNYSHHLTAIRGFDQMLRRLQPSLVYINNIVSMPAAWSARRNRIRCVWHIRELFADVGGEMQIPGFGGRRLVRKVLWSCADRLIVNSVAVAQNILGRTSDPRLSVIPNSVSDSYFEPRDMRAARAQLELPDGLLVGVPGTLRPMKGHPLLLEAAATLAAETEQKVTFAITGDGRPAYRGELLRLAHEKGLASRVRFLGRVNDMQSFYAACDVICVPSRAEPFGRVVIEAMASGKPVVATAVGGIPEIIDHMETGWLVPVDNPAHLAHTLLSVLSDPGQALKISSAARRHAAATYRDAAYCRRIVDIIDAVISSSDQSSQ